MSSRLVIKNLPKNCEETEIRNLFASYGSITECSIKYDKNGNSRRFAFLGFDNDEDGAKALILDQAYIRNCKVTVQKCEPLGPITKKPSAQKKKNEENEVDEEEIKVAEKERDEIIDSGRLFLRNLAYSTKEHELEAIFRKYGDLTDVKIIIDKKTGQCKGFAIIEFMFPESALAAYAAEDGKIFKGRMLHILPGAEKRKPKEQEVEEDGKERSSFKKEKTAKIKANVGKTHSWNTLFLGQNAVAETLAEKLGVEKSDLLLGESAESAGVRMALAETRLVREIRDFLLANGVKLDSFSRPASKRSDTVIIAKNLPTGVKEEELRRMFERHGEVVKFLMPPEAAVSALIVMGNAVDAKKTFKALAYSRFRNQPLYLEWAPGDVFGQDEVANKKKENRKKEEREEGPPAIKKSKKEMTYEEKMTIKRAKKQKQEIKEEPEIVKDAIYNEEEEEIKMETEEPEEEEVEMVIEPDSTVFVKNLSFKTTDDMLNDLFGKNYRIKSAQISKKLNPADPSKSSSMGFGFVQFYAHADAMKAIKEMQGEMLDGHSLELKISNRQAPNIIGMKRKSANATKQGQSTKLLVRNIPFQAKINEVENLFGTFGEIRSIRIPRKIGSSDQHRGFGFVDFLSVGEAKRAFQALAHSTHLYGRRLVLEWAKQDETVEELREKTAEKFRGDQKVQKKQKQRIAAIEKDLTRIDDD